MGLLAATLVTTACTSSSIAPDVRTVRDLTKIENVPRVADTDVDPISDNEARKMLEEPLDADAAVRIALLNNRELRATLREMGVARGRLVQAGLLPNPVFEVEVLPERNTEVELRVEYDITSAVLAPLRSRAMEPDLEAARYRAAAAVVDLGYRTRAAFYALQAAEQRLHLAQRVLDASAAARDAVMAMHQAGNVPSLDMASQVAAFERTRVMVAELELEVSEKRERVQRLLGAHGKEADWRVKGPLPVVPAESRVPDELERRALRANIELKGTKQRLEGLARRAGVTRAAGWLPDVSADVHLLQGNPDETQSESDQREWRIGAGVSATIPLFDRNQGTVTSLEAEFDALMERYYGMAVDLRSAARDTRNRLVSVHARALQYQDVIVPAQRQVSEQTLLQYNAMQVGIFQLIEARRQELDVELSYVEMSREYWTAVAELDALLAGRSVSPEASRADVSFGATTEALGEH